MSSTTTTKPQVLIVDDEERNRLAIAEILAEISLEAIFCASGQSALEAIRKNHPALIILDAEMPELDGYQVINQMHADEELSHIPVLLLTPNLSNEKQLQYASLVELIECVAKPVSAEVLKSKVQTLLQLDFYQHSIVELLNEDQQIVRKKQEGVIGLDINGKIIYVNSIAAKLLKTSTSELVGLYFESLFEEPNDHVVSVWQDHPIRRVCAEGNILQIDQVYLWRADGVSVKVKLAAIPFMEKSGTLDILMAFKLRRAKRGTQNNITQLMGMDHLTGLPNRTRFEDHLRTQITLANNIGLQIAVLFIDLSHFRHINQTLGHEFGDALLKEISQRLKSAVRSSDYLARISGDTFAVLATLNQDISDAGVVARKILKQLKESFLIHGHEVYAASHIGVATYPHSGDTPVALLKNAQTAAERAKSLGGNAYQFFTTEMNIEVVQKMLLEQDFHRAIDQHILKIDFEPIFDREHRIMVGYESIVRWPRAGKDSLLLADFLPIAERAGLSDRF
ncbi:MAG: diguanylate cyclase, partial [Pseudomonadota bacterium]